MTSRTSIAIKNSIATRILVVVLGLYLIIAMLITVSHVWIEYSYQKEIIIHDLCNFEDAFKDGLAVNLWGLDEKALHASIQGMLKIPALVGVKINNKNGELIAIGGIVTERGVTGTLPLQVSLSGIGKTETTVEQEESYNFEMFRHLFAIDIDINDEPMHLGQATIYSNSSVIYRRMKLQATMLAFNVAVILCTFFLALLWALNRYLRSPLASFAAATEEVSLENLDSFKVNIGHADKSELKILEESFNSMISNLGQSVAEQNRTEEILRKSEEQWERTFNSFTDIVTLQDTDLHIIKANQTACTNLNITCDTIVDRHCYELFRGAKEPCPDCPLLETKETFEPYSRDMYHEQLEKTFLVSAIPVFDVQEKLEFIAHVAKDITETKKLEEDRIRLAAAIDQASETIVITDLGGLIQYVNPSFEKLTGYSSEEALGQNPRILHSGKHDKAFYKRMWATLLRGEVWSGHMINKKKDGSLFEEEATISPVKNKQGQIINFVAVKRDVSKEVSLEKQLRQAMKMEAIGTLAGGIAHDFNNILTAILGYSEMARAQLPADDPIGKDLDQVIIAGTRATELVTQILTFSRQGDEDFKPLKVQLILKEVLKLLRASLPTTIQLEQSIDPGSGSIFADPTQIHQILMNLCTNARHAIGEENGTLRISLSEIEATEEKSITDCPLVIAGTYLDLEISDTGCGMDGLTKAKIFDPFYTTKKKGKGTGLGLSVVHGIIKQHGGEITVTSEPGKGSTFHVYLPVISVDIPDEHIPTKEIPKGNGERIFFIDDEPAIAHMMKRTLEKLGYTVTSFTSSVDALKVYKKNPANVNLVITDMTMPEMNGIELIRKLVAIRQDLPVILCTGFSETIDEATAKSFGFCEYIKKPVDKLTLAKALRLALSQ